MYNCHVLTQHHWQLHDTIVERLVKAYGSFMSRIGDPLDDGVLYGPMHSQQGIDGFLATVKEAQALGGRVVISVFNKFLKPSSSLKCSSYIQ